MSLCGSKTDTSGMNAAALANSQVAKDALDWYKQAYADQAPLRQQAADKALAVSDAQLASMKQNDAISNDYWNYQKDTFRPLEGKIIADAQSFDSPERQNQNAARATADVQQAFDAGQGQMQRAAALAGASNKARTDTELQGYARKMDAANLGRNLASNQATSAGVAGQFAGSAAGSAKIASFLSDKNTKQNIEPLSDTAALKAVRATPVSSWRYKDGQGDGGAHVGPMAQNVWKTMGETAAPGGKKIDLISMNGISMAAIAALDRKVGRLERRVGKTDLHR